MESPLKSFRTVDFTPGPDGGGAVPCDQVAMRGKMEHMQTFQIRRRLLMCLGSRETGAHQELMEQRAGPLDRLVGLLGRNRGAFPTRGTEPGDPMTAWDELRSDRRGGESGHCG